MSQNHCYHHQRLIPSSVAGPAKRPIPELKAHQNKKDYSQHFFYYQGIAFEHWLAVGQLLSDCWLERMSTKASVDV